MELMTVGFSLNGCRSARLLECWTYICNVVYVCFCVYVCIYIYIYIETRERESERGRERERETHKRGKRERQSRVLGCGYKKVYVGIEEQQPAAEAAGLLRTVKMQSYQAEN